MAKQKSSEYLRFNGLIVPKFEKGAKFWLEKFNKAGILKKWNEKKKKKEKVE